MEIDERAVLQEIAADADLLTVDGLTYIVARVSTPTIDALAALDAETEDMELDNEDACQAEDLLPSTIWRQAPGDPQDAEEDDPPGDVLGNRSCFAPPVPYSESHPYHMVQNLWHTSFRRAKGGAA